MKMSVKILVFVSFFYFIASTLEGVGLSQSLRSITRNSSQARAVLQAHEVDQLIKLSEFIEKGEKGVRSDFFAAIWSDTAKANELQKKKSLTDLLVLGLDDDYVGSWILNRLKLPPFEKNYFSDTARERIHNYDQERGQLANYLLVLGVADVEAKNLDLNSLSNRKKIFDDQRVNTFFANTNTEHFIYYNSTIWASLLVLARNGDDDSVSKVINEIKNTDKNTLVGRSKLIEDLGYIRQSEAIDILVELLFSNIPSDEQQPKHSDYTYMPLSHHAVKGLAISLFDFPIDYWEPVTLSNLERAREFIHNYEGPWKIKGKWKPQEQSAQEVPEEEDSVSKVIEEEPEPESVAQKPKPEEPKQIELSEPESESSNWLPWIILLTALIGVVAIVSRKKQ